jgi:hypothetical protein
MRFTVPHDKGFYGFVVKEIADDFFLRKDHPACFWVTTFTT